MADIDAITANSYMVRSTIRPQLQRAVEGGALREGLSRYERSAGRVQFCGAEANLSHAVQRAEAESKAGDKRPPWHACDGNPATPGFWGLGVRSSILKRSPEFLHALERKGYLMPILPLDHTEPFAATLGVMLYPGTDEDDQRNARALAARWLAEPFRRFHEAGHQISYDALASIMMDSGAQLSDLDDRCWGGTATGELFKVLFILAKDTPQLASWENAIRTYGIFAQRAGLRGARTDLREAIRRFRTVAHLWGAWSIREGKFGERVDVGYDGYDDFQSFLTEAEILRDFGQTWRPPRAKSKPPLPPNVWCVPSGWKPLQRQVGWPNTGMIPDLKLPDDLIAELRPPGRPRKPG